MIPIHKESARANSAGFHALANKVREFSTKVSNVAEGGILRRMLSSVAGYVNRHVCYFPILD